MAENWKDGKDYVTTESASYSRSYCYFWGNANSLAKSLPLSFLHGHVATGTNHNATGCTQWTVHHVSGKGEPSSQSPSSQSHCRPVCSCGKCDTFLSCVCVVENAPTHAALQASACTRRSTADVIPHVPGVLLYRIGSLPGLEFANEARLTGQQAPKPTDFCLPGARGSSTYHYAQLVNVGYGDRTRVLICVASILLDIFHFKFCYHR